MQFLKVLCVLAACSGAVKAQTDQPGIFHETATGLTMRYPVELVVLDAQKSIDQGHVAAFGCLQNQAKEHALASRCIKPILLAELPADSPQGNASLTASAASLLLFEFISSKECKAGFKYKDNEAVAGGIAQAVYQLPGAATLGPPVWFDLGKQKLHAAFAALGVQNTSPDQPRGLITMAVMRYHKHILGWLMFADHRNTFNDITKTSIELDDGKTYPLIPFNLDDQLRPQANIVK